MAGPDPLADLGREVGELIASAGFAEFAFALTVMEDGTRARSTCGLEGSRILCTVNAISANRFNREETCG